MEQRIKDECIRLFETWSGQTAETFTALPLSGSDRRYFRMQSQDKSAIAAWNPDIKENTAFITFSRHFRAKGCRVPQLYAVNEEKDVYLQEDLGDETLFSRLSRSRSDDHDFPENLIQLYKKVLKALPAFQITAAADLDYSVCYPRSKFDKQSMMWDLNYFKYYFLKLAHIPFDEQDLENDFHSFCDYLLQSPADHFLYRDFQSRNIMLVDEEPWFIDYQGGRKGALQYDLASLIYDAKASIPQSVRVELLDEYIRELSAIHPIDESQFRMSYYGFVLIRIMQAMGAYGFRGFYEKKLHFLQSIPHALDNLVWILKNVEIPVQLPALMRVLNLLVNSKELRHISAPSHRLEVEVSSFSYKRGIPVDRSGHGGGFVFDCRSVENPGKQEKFRDRSGLDPEVGSFIEGLAESRVFFDSARQLVDMSVRRYIDRDFDHLMISFGCTGGQHRSVYFAQKMADYLKEHYDIQVRCRHIEQDMKDHH